eukprot:359391-Rhodomonas_salina.1
MSVPQTRATDSSRLGTSVPMSVWYRYSDQWYRCTRVSTADPGTDVPMSVPQTRTAGETWER